MEIIVLTITPFVVSLLFALPITKNIGKPILWGWATAIIMSTLFIITLTLLPRILEEGAFSTTIVWVVDLGLQFTWYIEGLTVMFMLIVTGIAVFLYAGYYLEDRQDLARFYSYLSAFTGAMLLLVMAGNIILLFIAWEATSIISFLLIGFKGAKYEDARVGASRALVITGGGGLALLVGLLLMGTAAGTYEFADLLTADTGAFLRDHAWYPAFTFLIMIGCFTKSAQFPFHFWLPGGMSAPSPASAYLHSATMVKAGVYLLFRMYPTLGNTSFWMNTLLLVGLTTMTIGAVFAVRKRDLKGLLAYTTISTLGIFVALIALPDSAGLKAAALGIIAHALYKGTFFMLAGTVEHATGTRNLDELGGLRRLLPIPTAIAFVVGLSMAGYPPLVGFVAKEYLLLAMLPETGIGILPIVLVFMSALLNGVAALLFAWDVFISRPERQYDHFHAPPLGMHIGLMGLAGASLLFGLLIAPLLDPVLEGVLGKHPHLHLIPTEINAAVLLSLLVLVGSPALFFVRPLWMAISGIKLPSGAEIYAGIIRAVEWVGDFLLTSQSGKLRHYLIVILGAVGWLMVVGGFTSSRQLSILFQDPATSILKASIIVIALGATLSSILTRNHLLAVLALSVSGYSIGILFLLEPAPDVALVQILVETMVTVLTILMIARIDKDQRKKAMDFLWKGTKTWGKVGVVRDIIIATAIGTGVGLFALLAVNDRQGRIEQVEMVQAAEAPIPADDILRPITTWHLQNAYPEISATDVVGAIITDFRGTDTLIEIMVFSVAALGLLTILTLPVGREVIFGDNLTEVMDELKEERATDQSKHGSESVAREDVRTTGEYYRLATKHYKFDSFSTPLTRSVALVVFPFAILLSWVQILYGGSAPGDGFTAGIISGLAVASWYVVFGYFEARVRLKRLVPGRLIVLGLSLAFINAFLGLLTGGEFFGNIAFDEGSFIEGFAGLHITTSLLF
jgi:NADH:ubiquinone oxidoreductase subunit 5 (subunit L)/multisubunit Na+/H+ antiporter MnhA subunit/multisubunit Na+/H+ antiporter MnhB subunit